MLDESLAGPEHAVFANHESLMDESNQEIERELADHRRVLVGVNAFAKKDDTRPPRFTFDTENIAAHVASFTARKQARDPEVVDAALRAIHDTAARGDNCMEAMIDAFVVDATSAEVWGTFRTALGYPYDPFGVLTSPLDNGAVAAR